MKNLLCVVCILSAIGKVREAMTIYHGHALCQEHLKQAIRTKERKIW